MPPLNRPHPVIGHCNLKGGRLKFRTGSLLLAQEARQAMASDRKFTVTLVQPDHGEVTGRVLSVTLVGGVKPAQLEIVMRVSR